MRRERPRSPACCAGVDTTTVHRQAAVRAGNSAAVSPTTGPPGRPARRCPASSGLDADEIAAVLSSFVAEKVLQTDLEHRGPRRVGADVAADPGAAVVAAQHHRHGVPAVDVLDALLELDVAGVGRLLLQRDGVAIRGVEGGILDDDVGVGQVVADGAEQGLGALRTLGPQHGLDRIHPLAEFVVAPFQVCPSNRHACSLPAAGNGAVRQTVRG